ncbi:MAG: hypothetical protein R3E77_06195 [Steroidobacteraceae bacterium]
MNTTTVRTINSGAALGLMLGGVLSVAQQAAAADFDYALSAGAYYSDNLGRTPTNENGTFAAALGADVSARERAGRFRYDVLADLTYFEYTDSSYDGELLGTGRASGSFAFVPERFIWNASAGLGQARQSLLLPSTPSNRRDRIDMSTGPEFILRLGLANEIRASAQYARTDYSGGGAEDQESTGGRVVYNRRPSPRLSYGLGASFDTTKYPNNGALTASDFDRKEAFAVFSGRGPRTFVEAEVGYSTLKGGTVDSNGLLTRATLARRLTPSSTLSVSAEREFATAEPGYGREFSTPVLPSTGSTNDFAFGVPQQRDNFQAAYAFVRPRTTVDISLGTRRDRLLSGPSATRRFDSLRGSVMRRISPTIDGALFAERTSDRFELLGVDADETSFGTRVSVALSPRYSIDFSLRHNERNSNVGGADFTELAGGVFLRYGSVPRRDLFE